jgi:hypothetical protein
MDYEVRIFGKDGRLSHVRALRCEGDAEAVTRVEDLPYNHGVELWRDGRLIHRLPVRAPR